MSWKKVNLIQQEIVQPEKPIEGGGEPVEGEGEQQPPPEPVYETVEQISELGENVTFANSKVTFNAQARGLSSITCRMHLRSSFVMPSVTTARSIECNSRLAISWWCMTSTSPSLTMLARCVSWLLTRLLAMQQCSSGRRRVTVAIVIWSGIRNEGAKFRSAIIIRVVEPTNHPERGTLSVIFTSCYFSSEGHPSVSQSKGVICFWLQQVGKSLSRRVI